MKVDFEGSGGRGGGIGKGACVADHGKDGRERVVRGGVEGDMEHWSFIDNAVDCFVFVCRCSDIVRSLIVALRGD